MYVPNRSETAVGSGHSTQVVSPCVYCAVQLFWIVIAAAVPDPNAMFILLRSEFASAGSPNVWSR